mgnify:CR=1 FL=1
MGSGAGVMGESTLVSVGYISLMTAAEADSVHSGTVNVGIPEMPVAHSIQVLRASQWLFSSCNAEGMRMGG